MKESFKNLLKWPVKILVRVNNYFDKLNDRTKLRCSLSIMTVFVLLHIISAGLNHAGFKVIAWIILVAILAARIWWVEYASRKDRFYLHLTKDK